MLNDSTICFIAYMYVLCSCQYHTCTVHTKLQNKATYQSSDACGSEAKPEHILVKKLLCDLCLKKESASLYMVLEIQCTCTVIENVVYMFTGCLVQYMCTL